MDRKGKERVRFTTNDVKRDPIGVPMVSPQNAQDMASMVRKFAQGLPRYKDNFINPRDVLAAMSKAEKDKLYAFLRPMFDMRVTPHITKQPDHLVGVQDGKDEIVNVGCGRKPKPIDAVVHYDKFVPEYSSVESVQAIKPLYSKNCIVDCERREAFNVDDRPFTYLVNPNFKYEKAIGNMRSLGDCLCGGERLQRLMALRTKDITLLEPECYKSMGEDWCEVDEGTCTISVRLKQHMIEVSKDYEVIEGVLSAPPYMRAKPANEDEIAFARYFYPKLDGIQTLFDFHLMDGFVDIFERGNKVYHRHPVDVEKTGLNRVVMLCEKVETAGGDYVYYPVDYMIAGVRIFLFPKLFIYLYTKLRVQGLCFGVRPTSEYNIGGIEGVICVDLSGNQSYVKSAHRRSVDINYEMYLKLKSALQTKGFAIEELHEFSGVKEYNMYVNHAKIALIYVRDRDKKTDSVFKVLSLLSVGTLDDMLLAASGNIEVDPDDFSIINGQVLRHDDVCTMMVGAPNSARRKDQIIAMDTGIAQPSRQLSSSVFKTKKKRKP